MLVKKYEESGEVVCATNDRVFKSLIQDANCRNYTCYLISEITGIPETILYENMTFLNTNIPVRRENDKQKIADIIVSVKDKVIVLEMNGSTYYKWLFDKNSSYVYEVSNDLIESGQTDKDRAATILINLDNFNHFQDPRLIIKFLMCDPEGGLVESENFISYHVILTNVKKKIGNKEKLSKFEKAVSILTSNKENDLIKLSEGDETLMSAKKKIIGLTRDSNFIGLYDADKRRQEEDRDRYQYALSQGIEQGIEQGVKQGIEQGVKQGMEQGKLEMVRNLLNRGFSLDDITDISGLTKEEIDVKIQSLLETKKDGIQA